jgi:hypothetical protein
MYLLTLIEKRREQFIGICNLHKVTKMYAFGSSITSNFDEATSDVDLLVKVDITDPLDRGETLISLWDTLEIFFDRKVDLLTEESIHNPYLLSNIHRTKIQIYDRKGEKVSV